jgi:hypothetical protein
MRAELKASHEKGTEVLEEMEAMHKEKVASKHKEIQSQYTSGMAKIKQLQEKIKMLKEKK